MNMLKLNLEATANAPVTIGHIGKIANVIEGHVPDALKKMPFYQAHDYQCGFALASPDGLDSLGEALLVNDYCFTTSTKKHAASYLNLIYGKEFITPAFMLSPKEAKPTYRIKERFVLPQSLNEVYLHLYEKIKRPFVIAGFIEFAQLKGTHIAKPPIYHENIFAHKSAYYPEASQTYQNAYAYVVGGVANFNTCDNLKLNKDLSFILYQNPFDKQETITTHEHGLLLKKKITEVKNIKPDSIHKTVHIYSKDSLIKSIRGEIFVIAAIAEF